MSSEHRITLPQIIGKLPELAGHMPQLIKGSRMSKITDTKVPLGLGLAIEEAAAEHPSGIAVLYEHTEITYKQLNGWANRIADYLASIGIKKGDTVVVNIENRPELLASVLGCAKLGACAALVNTSQRGKVLVHSVNLVKPKAAIVGAELTDAVTEVRDQLELKDNFFCFADQDTRQSAGDVPEGYKNLAEEIRDCSSENPAASRQTFLNDPLFYIYTSGTTGLPKAVVFTHGRWQRAFGGFGLAAVRLKKTDRMYCTLPFYHATGMVVCWSSVIAGRAGLVLSRKFSASGFWDELRRYNCTAFGYVGELCRYLHEQPVKPNDSDNRVHTIVGNGLRPSIWDEFKQRFDINRIVELYASSEGNVAFTNVFNFDKTVGFSPVSYAIVKYDKETEAPVRNSNGRMTKTAIGEPGLMLGEITDKTPFDGYTDKEKTEKSIFRDVFKKGDAWFNTGDLMRDIGFRHAQFVDRLGDTFRWKGENVSTTEVEQILDGFEGIQESVVYGVEIPDTNGRAGMAQLRLDRAHSEFDFDALCRYLQKELPHFAIPVFLRINVQEMETTGTFKHQKNKLKEQGYDLGKQDNPIYVMLPKSNCYQLLDKTTQDDIDAGKYRF